jgi:transposase
VRDRTVAIKPEERQTLQLLHRQRSGWIGERTALGNRIRAMLLEFGIVLPQRLSRLRAGLPEVLEAADNGLPDRLRALLHDLSADLKRLDARIEALNAELTTFAREDPLMQLLLTIPGIGPINGTALLAGIGDASQFRRGRDLAAWLGLVPRQHSTGGKTRLLGISKHGNRHLRMMLIHGARAVLRVADKRAADDGLRRWVERITARKHANVAVVALANKLARIVCAVLQRREPFAPAQVSG